MGFSALHPQKDNPHWLKEQEFCCYVLRMALDAFELCRQWLLECSGDLRMYRNAGT